MLPSVVAEINTPEEVRKWLDTVLTYKYDEELYKRDGFWASCGLTYLNKAGDCEDYAICAAALLQGDVEKGYIVILSDRIASEEDGAHAVFAYHLNQKWGIISNHTGEFGEFRQPIFNTLHEALVSINFTRDQPRGRFRSYTIRDYSGVDLVNGNDNLISKIKEIEEGSFFP